MDPENNINKSNNTEAIMAAIKSTFGNTNKKSSKSKNGCSTGCSGCLGIIIIIVMISLIAEGVKSCSQSVSLRKDAKIVEELIAGKTYSGESEWTRVMGYMVKGSIRVDFVKGEDGKLVGNVRYKYSERDTGNTYVEDLICDIDCEYRNETSMRISSHKDIRKKSGDEWGGAWALYVDYSKVREHLIPQTIDCYLGDNHFPLYLQTSTSTISSSKKSSLSLESIHSTNVSSGENKTVQIDSSNKRDYSNLNTAKSTINYASERELSDYKMLIADTYRNAWQCPSDLTDTNAVTTVEIKINQDGSLHSSKIIKESGNQSLDTSVQEALKIVEASKFPTLSKGLLKSEIVTVDFSLAPIYIDKTKNVGLPHKLKGIGKKSDGKTNGLAELFNLPNKKESAD